MPPDHEKTGLGPGGGTPSRRRPWLPAALVLVAASPAPAIESPNAPARAAELRACLTDPGQVAPPGASVGDARAFCDCYADGAVKARLWELENAEANVGQEVRRPVADRTRRLHDEKSAALAAACLRR